MNPNCPICGNLLTQMEPWEFMTCDACNVVVEGSVTQPIERRIFELFLQLSPGQQIDLFCELTQYIE